MFIEERTTDRERGGERPREREGEGERERDFATLQIANRHFNVFKHYRLTVVTSRVKSDVILSCVEGFTVNPPSAALLGGVGWRWVALGGVGWFYPMLCLSPVNFNSGQ